jgi:hypothetical protein
VLGYDAGGESGGAGGTGEGCYGVFAACEEGGGDEAAYIAAGLGGWSEWVEGEGEERGEMNRERTPTIATLVMWFEVAIVDDWLKLWSRGLNLEVVVKKNVGNSVLRVRMILTLE